MPFYTLESNPVKTRTATSETMVSQVPDRFTDQGSIISARKGEQKGELFEAME